MQSSTVNVEAACSRESCIAYLANLYANYGHYNAYNPFAPTGNFTIANPWATAHGNNHNFAPLIPSNPLQLTESAFAASAASNNGIAFPIASDPSTWGPAAATAYPNSQAFTPFVNAVPSPLTVSTFAAGASYDVGLDFLTASNHYRSGEAVAPGSLVPHVGTGFQYPDPSFTMMSPYPAATNSNSYYQNQLSAAPGFLDPDLSFPMMSPYPAATNSNSYYPNQLSATDLDTNQDAAVESPSAVSSDIAPEASTRPTCGICNRVFSRQADLDRHAKKHQADSKVFRCRVAGCEYRSYRKDKLDDHVRRRHPALAAAST